MGKKKADHIENWSWNTPESIGIQLTRFTAEDDSEAYNAELLLVLETKDDQIDKAIILSTEIYDDDMKEIAGRTAMLVAAMFGSDVMNYIPVFDEEGELVEETTFSELLDINDDETPEYDLANMQAGVPVIKH